MNTWTNWADEFADEFEKMIISFNEKELGKYKEKQNQSIPKKKEALKIYNDELEYILKERQLAAQRYNEKQKYFTRLIEQTQKNISKITDELEQERKESLQELLQAKNSFLKRINEMSLTKEQIESLHKFLSNLK